MNSNTVGYMPHVGVMKEEISSLLKDVPEGYFIDATYGDGSHFEFIDSEKKLLRLVLIEILIRLQVIRTTIM